MIIKIISHDQKIWRRYTFPLSNTYRTFVGVCAFNPLRPRQNGRHFADDTFKRIFLNENVIISIKISLKCVSKGLISNIPALVQIMAWRRSGDNPLSEPMMVRLLTLICVTRPQWINPLSAGPVHIIHQNLCTTAPADALAPGGARASAGTALAIRYMRFLWTSFGCLRFQITFVYHIS